MCVCKVESQLQYTVTYMTKFLMNVTEDSQLLAVAMIGWMDGISSWKNRKIGE